MEVECTKKYGETTSESNLEEGTDILDNVMISFDKWNTFTDELTKQRDRLIQDVSVMTLNGKKLKDKNEELENDIKDLNSTIDESHKHLHIICDLKQENKTLKENIDAKSSELEAMSQSINSKQSQFEEIKLKLISDYKQTVEKQRAELLSNYHLELAKERANQELKQEEIDELNTKISHIMKENDINIGKITMDYEQKMLKLKHKNAATGTSMSNSSHQEIFRQKLQHQKADYEKEIQSLKITISDLQDKVPFPSHQQQPGGRVVLSANKKRRF